MNFCAFTIVAKFRCRETAVGEMKTLALSAVLFKMETQFIWVAALKVRGTLLS